MKGKIVIDIDLLSQDFINGMSLLDLAKKNKTNRLTIRYRLVSAGFDIPLGDIPVRGSHQLPKEEIVRRYLAGESSTEIAVSYGVSRSNVHCIVKKAGIQIRTISESSYARHARLGDDARKRMSDGGRQGHQNLSEEQKEKKKFRIANLNKGIILPPDRVAKRAKSNQAGKASQSHYEQELYELLKNHGVNCRQQQAVGPYNCDLSIGHVDIEIFGGWPWRLYIPKQLESAAKRLRFFLDLNWDTFIVLVGKKYPITETTAARVVAFVKECEALGREEPRIYRMIRGADEVLISGTALDEPLKVKPKFGKGDNGKGWTG